MMHLDWQSIFTGISTIFSALAMALSGFMSIKQGVHAQRIDELEERFPERSSNGNDNQGNT